MASPKFLGEASKQVRPLFAQGLFFVSLGYVAYYLVFYYYDPLGYYDAVLRDKRLFENEIARLHANMQGFLDEELVTVNGVRVRPRVVMIDVGFVESRKRPYILFTIRFRAPVRVGINVYENKYEPEVAEYDYAAYWVFPPGSRVLEVDMGSGDEEWDVVGNNIVVIYGHQGKRTGGYERIAFEIPEEAVKHREEVEEGEEGSPGSDPR